MLSGCGIFRDKSRVRSKTRTEITEHGVRIVEIPKDSIVYVPHYVFRDTTIVVQNRNLILKTTYRDRQVKRITAIQKPKTAANWYVRTEQKQAETKNYKSAGPELRPVYVLYLFGGLAFLIVVNNLTKSVKS